MAEEGRRRVQSKGEVTLPKEFRDDNDLDPGEYVGWKRHSRDKSKLIIEAEADE